MCQYQELAVNGGGYVIRCTQCSHYQLYFGSTILSLSQEEFATWVNYLERWECPIEATAYSLEQSAIIKTPRKGVHLALTPHQYKQLEALVQAADCEAKALALLQHFHQ
jgi:hypothetical protein